MYGLTRSMFNEPYEKKAVAWTLHCENPVDTWSWFFEDWNKFESNYDERSRWGECCGVTIHYADGTSKTHEMDAWSS